LAERYSMTVMGTELTRSIARCIARPFFSVARERTTTGERRATIKQTKKADPAGAIRLTTPVIRALRRSGEKAMNLAYGQLVRDRTSYRKIIGEPLRAKAELQTLISNLSKRGAHRSVLNSYNELARSLTSTSGSKPK